MLADLLKDDRNDVMVEEGSLCILNITEGDIKVSFNKDDPEETARAREMIEDMLKKGYSIMVKWGDGWRRAKKFISSRDSYVVEISASDEKGTTKRQKEQEIPAKKTRAIAIAPTAGG